MNKWLGLALAVAAIIGAFILGQTMHPFQDVNPVGFHVKGQVQINGNSLDASNCPATPVPKQPCTLTFDFALSTNSTPAAQACNAGTNCLSFTNLQKPLQVTVKDSSSSNGTTYSDYVSGQVLITQ